jgi:hypothetical protein
MRTVSVRVSLAEHRLLHDLAGARSVSVETLVREALAFPPIPARPSPIRHLEIVRSEEAQSSGEEQPGPTAPIA